MHANYPMPLNHTQPKQIYIFFNILASEKKLLENFTFKTISIQ